MKTLTFIRIGGLYHFFFAIMHLFFPKLFQWEAMLNGLPADVGVVLGIHLNIFNYVVMVFLVIFAVIPFFYARDIVETGVGKALLASIVGFWVIRIFVLQPVFAGITSPVSIMMELFFLVALLLFLVPWIRFVLLKKPLNSEG